MTKELLYETEVNTAKAQHLLSQLGRKRKPDAIGGAHSQIITEDGNGAILLLPTFISGTMSFFAKPKNDYILNSYL